MSHPRDDWEIGSSKPARPEARPSGRPAVRPAAKRSPPAAAKIIAAVLALLLLVGGGIAVLLNRGKLFGGGNAGAVQTEAVSPAPTAEALPSPTAVSSPSASPVPTATPAPTAAPTPDLLTDAAKQAYINLLKNNKTGMQKYAKGWAYLGGYGDQQNIAGIAIANVCGDQTPELLCVSAENNYSADLLIYSYDQTTKATSLVLTVTSFTFAVSGGDGSGSGGDGAVFTTQNGDLWYLTYSGVACYDKRYTKLLLQNGTLTESGKLECVTYANTNFSANNKYTIDGQSVSSDEFNRQEQALLGSVQSLLLGELSQPGSNSLQALTYDEAVGYLSGQFQTAAPSSSAAPSAGVTNSPPPSGTPASAADNTVGNSAGNLMSGGIAAIQNDWIYYCGGDGLYKINADGGGKQQLSADPGAWEINVVGDWVYYVSGSGICRIKTNGSGRQELNQEPNYGFPGQIFVAGDWIYYANNGLYRMQTDGSGVQSLNADALCFNVVGDWIYYSNASDGNKLYRMSTDGSGAKKLSDDASNFLNVVGDWIYYLKVTFGKDVNGYGYTSNGGLYRMNTDGSNRQKLSDDVPINPGFNVAGDWIYYFKDVLYRMKTDGSAAQAAAAAQSTWNYAKVVGTWSIVGNTVYFSVDQDFGNIYRMNLDGTNNQPVG